MTGVEGPADVLPAGRYNYWLSTAGRGAAYNRI